MGKRKPTETEFERAVRERRARGDAAWGAYGAYVRQRNFDQELKVMDEAIDQSWISSEEKQKRQKERDEFVRKCESDTTMHVGPF